MSARKRSKLFRDLHAATCPKCHRDVSDCHAKKVKRLMNELKKEGVYYTPEQIREEVARVACVRLRLPRIVPVKCAWYTTEEGAEPVGAKKRPRRAGKVHGGRMAVAASVFNPCGGYYCDESVGHVDCEYARAVADGRRFWRYARDGDPVGFELYRRHYSSAKNPHPKQRQFVGPGESMVLLGLECSALFVWRKEAFRQDAQRGVNCAVFRNESWHLSSEMIREAVELAWRRWPGQRLFTMVNHRRVKSSNPGYCFFMAGWRRAGFTGRGLYIWERLP